MAKRQREWARRTRDKIKALLGGKCTKCGSTKSLEFDCKEPMGDSHHKAEWSHRMSFYRLMLAKNNLQLLCDSCHNEKSATEQEQFPF